MKEIIPTQKEKKDFKKTINSFLKKLKIKDAKIILGGSAAKDTWLKNNKDIDIYIAYPKNTKNISDKLKKSIKSLKPTIMHGSRDYFQITYKNYTFELIPILKINHPKQAENLTDLSPLHVKWVKKHKKGNEIRKTKAFFKAINCYGAESYKRGFSGYALEILTIYYKTFSNFLKKASKWKSKTYIDPQKHGIKLNKSKTHSPLTLIDPVQNDRNATAALSKEKYNLFIKMAKEYLKNPSDDFFKAKKLSLEDLKNKAKNKKLILLKATPKRGKTDIIGCKLLKAFKIVKKQLIENHFEILDSGWEWDKKAIFWYILPKKQLSKHRLHKGPPLTKKANLKKFQKKYKNKNLTKKGGRIYVKLPRKYQDSLNFTKELIKTNENLKEQVKSIQFTKSM